MDIQIIGKAFGGRVDASLRPWRMEGGDLTVNGKIVAKCRVHNFASGGFDLALETWSDLPGVRKLLRNLPRKGNHLAAIAAWVQRHPETLRRDEIRLARCRADREPVQSAGRHFRRMIKLQKELEAESRERSPRSPLLRGEELEKIRGDIKSAKGRLSRPLV